MPVIKYKNRVIQHSNKAADVRNLSELTLEQTIGGVISSNKLSGYWNDEVTLYNTPSAHYDFNGYSLTGASLYDNNKFKFCGSAVTAKGSFTPWPVRSVTLEQTSGGTIGANPMTGYDGDTCELSNTPDTDLTFSGYEITGSTLFDENKFIWTGGNVNVKGIFYDMYNPLNLPNGVIRVRTNDGNPPERGYGSHYSEATLVEGTTNEYDCYQNGNTFYAMFFQSRNITDVLGANTKNVTNFAEAFYNCSSLSSVSLFDTSKATVAYYMFKDCTNLESIPGYNFSSLTSIGSMFRNCSKLNTVGLLNVSNCTNLSEMFYGCASLETIPLINFENARNMDGMFNGCSNLKYLPNLNTHNVSSFEYMFSKCTKLTSPIVLDTTNAISLRSMYSNCSGLTAIPMLDTTNVTNVSYMFYLCRYVESGISAFYNQMANQTNPPSEYSYCFRNCGTYTQQGTEEWRLIPNEWK